MSQVISFTEYTPAARYDSLAWTEVRIYESDAAYDTRTLALAGTWTLIDTITLSPVELDPADPIARSFTTENGSATTGLWYRVVFADADGDVSLPTTPVQNVDTDPVVPYATVEELARILKIRTPSAEQETAMERVLEVAAGEINAEIDLSDEADPLSGWQLALTAEVNLERAVEHWRQMESPFGLIGLGPEMPAERTARDSWERHAHKLAPLKSQWGVA